MSKDFNDDFNDKGEKPRYIHKRNPLVEHAYQIFEFKDYKGVNGTYEPVGDYTLLDTAENSDLTERKLMNLMQLMNGKKDLMDLKDMTGTRTLFTKLPRKEENDPTKIIFRTYDGDGVSTENAMLVLEKGIYDEA